MSLDYAGSFGKITAKSVNSCFSEEAYIDSKSI